MSVSKKALELFKRYKNPHNDPVKRAAFDVAIANAISNAMESIIESGKSVIKDAYKNDEPGYNGAILAEKGIAVMLRINNGAERMDNKKLPAAILKAGWKSSDGKLLSLAEIDNVLSSCKTRGAPSFTISSTVSDDLA